MADPYDLLVIGAGNGGDGGLDTSAGRRLARGGGRFPPAWRHLRTARMRPNVLIGGASAVDHARRIRG